MISELFCKRTQLPRFHIRVSKKLIDLVFYIFQAILHIIYVYIYVYIYIRMYIYIYNYVGEK